MNQADRVKNCIIMGSGRSGTSLAAGILSRSGYYMGEKLNPANITNPKGQFEDREVNSINEEILAPIVASRPEQGIGKWLYRSRPQTGQRWLARVPVDTRISGSADIAVRIRKIVGCEPYCLKDPRFSYTLPVWKPFLGDPVFMCVFRHPAVTVSSILKQKKTVPHLKNFAINAQQAFMVWEMMYSHILENHVPAGGKWLFFHYNQLLDGAAYAAMESSLNVKVDPGFADPRLSRSQPTRRVNKRCFDLYRRLNDKASYLDSSA